jgi:hypothetical protein
MLLLAGSIIFLIICLILNIIISEVAKKKLLPEEMSKLIELQSKSINPLFFIIVVLYIPFSYFIYSPPPLGIIFFLLAISAYLVGNEVVFVKKLKKANMPPSYLNTKMVLSILFFSSVVFLIGMLAYTATHGYILKK